LKVLFINNFFSEYGGAEKLLLNQALLLKKNNIEVFFFASSKQPFFIKDYKYSKYFPEYTEFRKAGKFKAITQIKNLFYNETAKNNLKEYIKEIKPDIAHIHNIHYVLTVSVIDACKEMKIPVVMSSHDPRIVCPGGTLRYKNQTYCKYEKCINSHPFNCIFNKCKDGSLKSSLIATAENIFALHSGKYDYVSGFITPSKALYSLLSRAGFEKSRLKHIPNFLEDTFLNNLPNYSNKGYFLYVGRLAEEKGVGSLIRAASRLPEEIKIHIVGEGPHKNELEKKAKGLRVQNVIFKGFLKGKELDEEYKNCIATILPCNWFETFGLTIIESFAWGKPVIASRIGAIPELITDFENGFMFEPENSRELANAIKKIYKDKELTYNMALKCRKKAEIYYNSALHYENLTEFYKDILKRKELY